MNFSTRRGESRPSGHLRPRRSVGTRGGCGDGWGPCACPRGWRFRQGFMLTHWISSPGGGQAQGPLIHPTPPLVPTGRLTSSAAFGRQHSLGEIARSCGAFAPYFFGGPLPFLLSTFLLSCAISILFLRNMS